jgi:hypothetical protein
MIIQNEQKKEVARKIRLFLKKFPKLKKALRRYAIDLDEKIISKNNNQLSVSYTDNEIIKKLEQYQIIVDDYTKLLNNDIIIYFFGKMGQTYQIKQWIDTFIELNKKHRISVVVRDSQVQQYFTKILPFPIKYCNTINDVFDFYTQVDPKVIMYINNGFKNFQSLIYENSLHIHINHGESDKSSDHSNQVKGYDYIFVHGQNGYNNYMKYLIKLNPKRLVITGRPQLDFIKPISINTNNKKVILYVTTWEATHQSMRYTSVDVYGEKIVNKIIDSDEYFFIYKPHPNLGANDSKVKEIHKKIIEKVNNSKNAIVLDKEDVNNIYPIADFAIFDMSSTMTDFLQVNKPFLLADVFNSDIHNINDYNVLHGCNRITSNNIDNLLTMIKTEIDKDPMKEKRQEIKELYLGNYKEGESIKKFINSVSNIIQQRDQEIQKKYNK